MNKKACPAKSLLPVKVLGSFFRMSIAAAYFNQPKRGLRRALLSRQARRVFVGDADSWV